MRQISYSFLVGMMIFMGLMSCNQESSKVEKKPIPVQYIIPEKATVPVYKEFMGQTLGKSDVQVVARVEGVVTAVHYREGDFVSKGKLLYTIDPLQYKTKVDESKGGLNQAQSELINAEQNLKRIKPLAEMNAVSKRDLDDAVARVEVAKAKVQSMQAGVQNQQIRLGYCDVTAPVSGVIGISPIRVGDYVSPLNQKSLLNTISDISQIRVRFSITENEYLALKEHLKVDSIEKNISELELILSNGQTYPHKGVISFKDRSIDPSTGALSVEALFPNPDKVLIPGLYARVKVLIQKIPNAIAVPQRAVKETQGLYQVNIINEKNVLELRSVAVGLKNQDYWVITKGLNGNERVAILGNAFLAPGSVVEPVKVLTDSLK